MRIHPSLSLLIALPLAAQSAASSAPKAVSVPAAPAPAAPAEVPVDPHRLADLRKLRDAALQDPYAHHQLEFLCDSIGPRISGSPQAQAAVERVAAEMRKLGLEVRLQKVTVPHWVRGEERAELTAYPGQAGALTQKLFVAALGNSVATPPAGLTAEVLVVPDFDTLEALGKDKVQGKIVVFNHPFDTRMAAQGEADNAYGEAVVYRGQGASAAARLGAIASLVRSVGGADFRLPHTGAMRYAKDAPKIPHGALAAEDADLIARLTARGPVKLHLTLTPQTLPDVESFNVIADLKGSVNPEQVVVVSGHLDSWDLATGALDDGAGVTGAMGVLRAVQASGLKPRRTLRFIAWMDEENGAPGAKAYFLENQADLKNQIAAIEMDSGVGHPAGFVANVTPGALARLTTAVKALGEMGAGNFRRVYGKIGTDIAPLTEAGVPSFDPLQDMRTYFNYHHTPPTPSTRWTRSSCVKTSPR